ncbi:leucine--tRNA ligase [Patescibacteria group bacterium]
MEYNPQKIEKKWQKLWEEQNLYNAEDFSQKPKSYMLVEFPYPSGDGLHVGHCRSYVALDIISRKRRMEGKNVLYPMGWDAFGLPTENYAVKTGIHPRIVTEKNTTFFKRQQQSLALSIDWEREINTTDPKYYKWTQWIFVQLFKQGLAYKANLPINWCPACKIGLANEEVVEGRCERCGKKVEKKEKEQWMLKITKYAERLIADLELVDYPTRVKTLQKDWIGKSEGAEVKFKIENQHEVPVFTTRPDTLFGCTYLVLSPEHPLINILKPQNSQEVKEYVKKAKEKTEIERISEVKEKTGVQMQGIKAINPVNNEEIPVFIADYVLISYGTGAIMAVPSHDQRDFDFAKKYHLEIRDVIEPIQHVTPGKTYEGEGKLINSGKFNGIKSEDARKQIIKWLSEKRSAKEIVYYKLRDWIFSRQRYWGEPIPMVNCAKCGWIPVPEKDLPVELPDVKNYKPTEKGESPLAKVVDWVSIKCPKCKGVAKRETDVMPNWAGSNWYFLRYCDPKNEKKLAGEKLLKYWMPVDWYNGGMEHTTLHLLYSRFIFKFLWDIGVIPKSVGSEPYTKRTSHGIILGEGGIKMSKSKGNVINPDKVIIEYGADTLRTYEMFMGPFEQTIAWDTKGVKGARRFLEKVWKLSEECIAKNPEGSPDLKKILHKTIKKVTRDIESLKFNTAVSSLMEFSNAWQQEKGLAKEDLKDFLKILSPFAPYLTEEIWEKLDSQSIHTQSWPEYDSKLIEEKTTTFVIQINGKVRGKIEAETDISEDELKELALSQEQVKKWIERKKIKKIVFVKRRLVNIVI